MFLNFCHWLNRLGLSGFVAGLRWRLLNGVFSRFVRESKYSTGSDVPGYRGWISLPMFGVLAFRRSDGSIQYEW